MEILTAILLAVFLLFNSNKPVTEPVKSDVCTLSVDEIVELTNKEREANGLRALRHNKNLDKSAEMKALHMDKYNYWSHYAPDGTTPWYFFHEANYDYIHAGENLAKGYKCSDSIVRGWMDSPTHRANILSTDFEEIGVAVGKIHIEGEQVLAVQHFGTK